MSLSEIKDLRKTNFPMGCECPCDKEKPSVYKYDYRRWPLGVPDNTAETYKFQKTKFILGDEEGQKNQWVSTNAKDFTRHHGVIPSRLNEDQKRDLRTHHFEFGNLTVTFSGDWKGTKVSEFTDEYVKKHTDIDTANSDQLKNKLRKHNFKIGDSDGKLANSVYDTTYVKHPFDPNAGPNAEELKKKVVELRNTNLVLGQDQPIDMTTMKDHYRKINDFEPTILNRAQLQKTHFQMGEDAPQMTSINRTYYKAPKIDPSNSVEAEKRALIEDLRKHHFDFGQSYPDFDTENRVNYVKHGLVKPESIDPNLMKNHFEIGDGKAPFENNSCYTRDMRKHPLSAYAQGGNNEYNGRDKRSNWDFGGMDNNWQSEFKSQ